MLGPRGGERLTNVPNKLEWNNDITALLGKGREFSYESKKLLYEYYK